MNAPQIIIIALFCIELGAALAKDGQPKEGEYSFLASAIASALFLSMLWWGGFFSK